MSEIIHAYETLKREYNNKIANDYETRLEHNPIKTSFSMRSNDKVITCSTNVMSAKTDKGIFTKIISIDDLSGVEKEHIYYVSNDMKVLEADDVGLTTLRCALMACMSVEKFIDIQPSTKVGFIGNGKINQKTFEMMNLLFGTYNCVIRGSKRQRDKNIDEFKKISKYVVADTTTDMSLLNECDVIISCTTSVNVEDTITCFRLNKPTLFIAQDSGYLFDSSFRKHIKSYSDHMEQLDAHYAEEFPFDIWQYPIRQMPSKYDKTKERRAVYLYGIAFADAILFEELYLKEGK